MNADLQKRLEEAAHESSMGELIFGREVSCWIGGFKEGAEWGYKEAIAQAKEWFSKISIKKYLYDSDGRRWFNTTRFITDFETDMNKLWEEKK